MCPMRAHEISMWGIYLLSHPLISFWALRQGTFVEFQTGHKLRIEIIHILFKVVPKLFLPKNKTNKLHGLSPQANYTDRATAACRRSVANFCG
jgi:hypothetical protein